MTPNISSHFAARFHIKRHFAAVLCNYRSHIVTTRLAAGKKGSSGKSKEELTLEKRRELERRLQDVSGQLNSVKKPTKPKGELVVPLYVSI